MSDPTGDAEAPRPLPEKVRQRLVEVAADKLGHMSTDEIPAPLRRVARFDPPRRERTASSQIAAYLESDAKFRTRVAEHLREQQPRLAEELERGEVPATVDPAAAAAAVYLLRPEGWRQQVEGMHRTPEPEETAAGDAAPGGEGTARLNQQIDVARGQARADVERLCSDVRGVQAEVADLRRELRGVREAREAAERERAGAHQAASTAGAEFRRLRERLADGQAALPGSAGDQGSAADMRVDILLDALLEAAQGLRRELGLPPTERGHAEAAAASAPTGAPTGTSRKPGRRLTEHDPALLDRLLDLPRVHLVVDGYNVARGGYPTLTLEGQRGRLLDGLGVLAAQAHVEVTCVFDGGQLAGPAPNTSPRGVRVLVGDRGQSAEAVIRRLVRAESQGRAVVVVSSDREIAGEAGRCGARSAPASVLLRWLDRG